ncbi:MAG: hypothetical protein WDN69_17250 [Aliidongia sp.]
MVYAEENDDGTPTGKCAVAAGERRRNAGLALVKTKEWKKTQPMPCKNGEHVHTKLFRN